MKKSIWLFTGFVIWVFNSCVERFEIDLPQKEDVFLVEAALLDDDRYQYVKLSKTAQSNEKIPMEGATVFVEDSEGEFHYFLETDLGVYQPETSLTVSEGESYKLHATLNDEIKIESEWETVPREVGIAEAFWTQETKTFFNQFGFPLRRTGFDFKVTTTDLPENEVFLRYQYETTHINEAPFPPPLCTSCINCYIRTVPSNFINQVTVKGTAAKPLIGHSVQFVELDVRFSFRFTMLIQQITYTENAHEFYAAIAQQRNLQGSIFDPPPALIRGNVFVPGDDDVTVYGLFEVGRITEAPVSVLRSDFENEIITYWDRCISQFRNNRIEPSCEDCNREPGAGPRPYYF